VSKLSHCSAQIPKAFTGTMDYSKLSRSELVNACKERGIKGCAGKKKSVRKLNFGRF
jgi:hypothetical protein